ncbi:codeine O-demethylase-like [Cynara cardunculus var. scolymus]|uniref:Non-heme dioxygenase N-terminal domain-containing protein n=1 Tax=Cynara cardunculus var. scolymus TaxID=59895 RepID=A0A124SB39_CYNCS|nr:codeine O-demethylase-like [Cynara cardunculus var. scolymus]KVH89441.1 Non-heme dioxygenase N-terminal domain-containing protein [Cynara cardunculus var. scolymus]
MAFTPSLVGHGSVQELAKELNLTVPHHYVQEHQEPTFVPNGSSPTKSIPVIDMNDFIVGGSDIKLQLENLRSVCHEWGIFQLVNHGVDRSLVERMKKEMVEFFKIPIEEKLRYKLKGGEYEGYGQTILHGHDQKVDWADRFYMITNPLHRRKSNLLPEFPPLLRDTLEKYLLEVQKLGMSLFGLIGQAVDIDNKEMFEIFEDGMQSVRMTYYPPCPQPDLVIGLTPHSDAAGITILLQVNDVDGLQVKKDGIWIPVNFRPDAFIVNVGDILEILSNGVCNSIEHRAIVNATKERMSLAMFFNPKMEADVGPSKGLLTSTRNPPLYKTLVMEQYLKEFFSRKLNGKAFLKKMKIKDEEGYET